MTSKTLALLTAVVLLLHLLLLRAAANALPFLAPQAAPINTFVTRAIDPAIPRSVPSLAPAALRPKPPNTPRPTTVERSPLASDAPVTDLAPPGTGDAAPGVSDSATAPAAPLGPIASEPSAPAAVTDELALAPAHPPRQPQRGTTIDTVARSVRLLYAVESNKFPYSLNAELVWQVQGDNYAARLTVGAFGQARVQTSRGTINAGGLAPLRFSDKYRSELAAHFNYPRRSVTFSANTPDAPLLNGAQDRLSVLIQLGSMLASARARYTKASTITVQTIGPRDADNWLFTVGEEETVSLPGGELTALKLTRNPRREFDQKVELWLAPALEYLPARLRITEANGNFIDQKWLRSEAADELLSLHLSDPALEIRQCNANCTPSTFKG